jgi:hypothetical protein
MMFSVLSVNSEPLYCFRISRLKCRDAWLRSPKSFEFEVHFCQLWNRFLVAIDGRRDLFNLNCSGGAGVGEGGGRGVHGNAEAHLAGKIRHL